LTKVFYLGEHHNNIKHHSKQPWHHAMLQQLNNNMAVELLTGAWAVFLADGHHFDLNLTDLLDQSTQYKKNWLFNIIAVSKGVKDKMLLTKAFIHTASIANSKLIKDGYC